MYMAYVSYTPQVSGAGLTCHSDMFSYSNYERSIAYTLLARDASGAYVKNKSMLFIYQAVVIYRNGKKKAAFLVASLRKEVPCNI